MGQRLLVGITYLDTEGHPIDAQQFCGRVLEVADGVVVVERPGEDDPAVLPADAPAYRRAEPGRYTLQESGETVIDPDFIVTWRVVRTPDPPAVQEGFRPI